MSKSLSIFKSILLLLLIDVVFQPLTAQIKGRLVDQSLAGDLEFTVTQFSTREGLPQNQINEIISKANGSLILSTTNGLVEFNGYQFLNPINVEKTRKFNFQKLYWSEKHKLLCGRSYYGPFYVISPDFKIINPAEKYKDYIRNSYFQGDTVHLISGSGRIFMGTLPDLKMKEIFNTNLKVTTSLIYQAPHYYLCTIDGFYRINTLTGQQEQLKKGPFKQVETNPYNHRIYVLSTEKLYRLNHDSLELVHDLKTTKDEEGVRNMTFMDSSRIVVATLKGIYCITKHGANLFTKNEGLLSNRFVSVYYYAPEKCLFAGTMDKGLLKFQFKLAKSFSRFENQDLSSLNSIVQTPEGNLLTGQNCCNLIEFTGDKPRTYADLRSNFAVLSSVNDQLWVGTWGAGVFILKNKKLVGQIKKPTLSSNDVHAIFKDSDGNIWIGTNTGISVGQNMNTILPLKDKLLSGKISTFYELKNKDICVGSENGVHIFRHTKLIKTLGSENGIRGKEVRSFYEDAEGKLWIGTYGGGIYCYQKDKLTSLNSMPRCRLDKDAFCFAKDNLGYIFISSNKGLWRVSEKALNDFYYQRINYLIPFMYNEEAGIINTEFNGGFQNTFLKTKTGQLYFPTIEGYVKITPAKIPFRKLATSINELYVNDTITRNTTRVFERSTGSLIFGNSVASYNPLYNIYFQHKLIGERSYDWSPPQKSNSANLRLLSPGSYTFLVRAIDGFNDPSPTETKFEFEIKPYYYETLWFKILCILIFIALTVTLAIWRINELKRKTKLTEQYSRKLAEIELKAIQAQLNPHFLFNCMNTMKHFILEKNYQKANESLNKISYLVRNSLENSDKVFVSLFEKIKFITNYIELEKIRLTDDLDYSINCEETIDKLTPVPNFLIQPYIENAIKHGINHLESKKGQLRVNFFKSENNLVCTITDNGIGRKASFARNKNNFLHISKGTTLTVEKTSFLKLYNNYNCKIDVEDLYDEKENATGTKVTITMPLDDNYRNN